MEAAITPIRPLDPASKPATRIVAVVDIGTTSIRMAIAEIDQTGTIRPLENLSQAVGLGKDTFTKGQIEKSTIEECVRVLRSYRRLLQEYRIEQPDQIRVVATSAVREAGNRLAFLDRVYSATGFEVQAIDDAEVSRITYLGVLPLLASEPGFATAKALVTEVGGGSTELLLMQGKDVVYSHSYRLGSIRLREQLLAYRAPVVKARNIMESQIKRTIEQIVQHVPRDGDIRLVALGGDVRFAARQILREWDHNHLAAIDSSALEKLTNKILSLSEDQLIRKYHVAFTDAETLGPALLAYLLLAQALDVKTIYVSNVNLRDGLFQDMAVNHPWTEDFANQIIRSALDLGKKFEFDEAHGTHVAKLCKTLFAALKDEHQLDPRYELILYVAALLHEIGLYLNTSSHHKHSMYLINNSELFGLSRKDLLLVALVARYHRRASPKPNHPGYGTLDRESRIAVSKMAAMLRVADALDRSHSQRIQEIHCERDNGRLVISTPRVADLSLEQLALKQKGALFTSIFGLKVQLRRARSRKG